MKKNKILALVLACVICVGIGIGGTLAWLTATTDNVTNTFTTSDIDITLAETEGGENKEFKMVPGWTITKDPKVTVTTGSEDCYLFVKLEESDNFGSFMTYDLAEGWTKLEDGVYYREVTADDMGTEFSVLANDQVIVKDTVTKAAMNALTSENDYPTLTVTAYATQLWKSNDPGTGASSEAITNAKFTPADAWDQVKPTP